MKNVKLATLSALLLGALALCPAHADAKARVNPIGQPTVKAQPRETTKPQAHRAAHKRGVRQAKAKAKHRGKRRQPRMS